MEPEVVEEAGAITVPVVSVVVGVVRIAGVVTAFGSIGVVSVGAVLAVPVLVEEATASGVLTRSGASVSLSLCL